MSQPLRGLGRTALLALAAALEGGRLTPPFRASALVVLVPEGLVEGVRAELQALDADGMAPRHIARALVWLAEERAAGQRTDDRIELVWSPPELDHVDARDTFVVVQDLFRSAQRRVLVSTFNVDEGPRARALFGTLAANHDANPGLVVQVFANIERRMGELADASELVREFGDRFRKRVWPGVRLPELFFDPRSLALHEPGLPRAVLHAKCVVVDDRFTLLTSANFSEAAQERNIEAGVVVDDPRLTARLWRQFDALVGRGDLRRVGALRSESDQSEE